MPYVKQETSSTDIPKLNGAPQSEGSIENTGTKLSGICTFLKILRDDENLKELENIHQKFNTLHHELALKDEQIRTLQNEKSEQKEKQQNTVEDLFEAHDKIKADHDNNIRMSRDQIAKLESQRREKDAKCEGLEEKIKRDRRERSKIEDDLQHTRGALEDKNKEAAALDKKLKDVKKISNELNKSLEQKKIELGHLQKELKSTKDTLANTTANLSSTGDQLSKLKSMALDLGEEDLDITRERFKTLWLSGFDLVSRHFQADLSKSSLDDDELWQRLGSFNEKIPLPRSNSPVAKDVRCALILAFLFKKIDDFIFQPNYFDGSEHIRSVLLAQALEDNHKEAFCRSLLLSMLPDDQMANAKKRADKCLLVFVQFIHGIDTAGQNKNIQREVKKLIESAYETWATICRLRPCYQPTMGIEHDPHDHWHTLSFHDGASGVTSEASKSIKAKNKAVLVVFPGLYRAEQNSMSQVNGEENLPQMIEQGVVLREDHFAAAEQEISSNQPSSPSRWRMGQFSRRRESNAVAPKPLGGG